MISRILYLCVVLPLGAVLTGMHGPSSGGRVRHGESRGRVGQRTSLGKRRGPLAVGRAESDVCAAGQNEAEPGHGTVDRGDDWLFNFQCLDLVGASRWNLHLAGPFRADHGQQVHVGADAKLRARARHDDDTDTGVGICPLESVKVSATCTTGPYGRRSKKRR